MNYIAGVVFKIYTKYKKKYKMEILGLDPKLMICKITVLPIKLYPLFLITHKGFEPLF
jgi:hypothetical protein